MRCVDSGEGFEIDFDFQVDCNGFSLKEGWFESILFDSIGQIIRVSITRSPLSWFLDADSAGAICTSVGLPSEPTVRATMHC